MNAIGDLSSTGDHQMSDTQQTPPASGHNDPPLPERLAIKHEALVAAVRDLDTEAKKMPASISDDDGSALVSDFIKKSNGYLKRIKALRVDEKEPFLKAGREVDGFFQQHAAAVEAINARLNKTLTAYLTKKADDERMERLRIAAERAAEEKRQRDLAEAAIQEARDAEQAGLRAEQIDAVADASAAMRGAQRASVDTIRADRAAAAAPAELARTRGTQSLATLSRSWEFEILDPAEIDMEILRPFISRPALEAAVRAFVVAGNRELSGVQIYEATKANVR